MKEIIQKVLENSEKNLSEFGTIIHLILPIFEKLNWKIGMVDNLIFEDSTVTNKRVDLKFIANNKTVLLEAKRVNLKLQNRDFEQLTNYLNSDNSAEIGILTNGIDFWIADNNQNGGLKNKLIYKFSLKDVSSCDLQVIDFLKYPFDNLEKLTKKIQIIKLEMDLDKNYCKKLQIKSNQKLQIQDSKKLPYSKIFFNRIEKILSEMQNRDMDLEKIFNENEAFFKKLKPKNLTCRKSEKFNIWIVTNSSSKQKDKYLNKLQKYLKK